MASRKARAEDKAKASEAKAEPRRIVQGARSAMPPNTDRGAARAIVAALSALGAGWSEQADEAGDATSATLRRVRDEMRQAILDASGLDIDAPDATDVRGAQLAQLAGHVHEETRGDTSERDALAKAATAELSELRAAYGACEDGPKRDRLRQDIDAAIRRVRTILGA
jgi:hypothetical protein